jgi:uncharacterized repeat protein (TIGR04076 family)
MDRDQLVEIIGRRLNLPPEDWERVRTEPRFQRLFDSALAASKYQLVAEVVESKGCHSGHVVGQRLYFDSSANLLTEKAPKRVCMFLTPSLTVLINAFFENLMNGRDPNEVIFNRTGCFDVGPRCGGWGRVVFEVRAEEKT